MKNIEEYLTEKYINSYKILKDLDYKNVYFDDLRFERSLAEYVQNLPKPKILFCFFREHGFIHTYCRDEYTIMFDHSQIQHIANFIDFLEQNNLESEIMSFLSEFKKYYSRLLSSKKNDFLNTFTDIKISQFDFSKLKHVDNNDYVNIYKSLFEDCRDELALQLNEDDILKKSQIKEFFERRKIEIEDNLVYINDEFKLYKNIKGKKEVSTDNERIRKFQWTSTEEMILRIIELLFKAGFISSKSYNERYAVLRDTFLNKHGEPFNNKQLSVAQQRIDKQEKITNKNNEFSNFNKLFLSIQDILDS